ncbi:MAG: MFS transporter [Planctomycetota bacterium]
MSEAEEADHPTPPPSDRWRAWSWIPTLYFAEGLPLIVVLSVATVMYKQLGVSNTEIALYTSLLYLPWTLKPLWSPLVDLIGTQRGWTIAMQVVIAAAMFGVGTLADTPGFFVATLAAFWVMAIASATHDIAADGFYMASMSARDQAWFVGIRSSFYRLATIAGSGLLVILAGHLGDPPEAPADPMATGGTVAVAAEETPLTAVPPNDPAIDGDAATEASPDPSADDSPAVAPGADPRVALPGAQMSRAAAWSWTFTAAAGLYAAFAVYHLFGLPRPAASTAASEEPAGDAPADFFTGFGEVFASFFRKPNVVWAIAYMLLYRFSEAQLAKLKAPFLIDPVEEGGVGLTTVKLGFLDGTLGVSLLTLGGILGGLILARDGLRRWILPMALAINVPNAAYAYLAFAQPESEWVVGVVIAIEQLGYGLGFSAYMLYMLYFSRGEHQTAHYAICTGFMALGMMIPGMFCGAIQETLGYDWFFVWVTAAMIPSLIVTALLPIPDADPEEAASGDGERAADQSDAAPNDRTDA